MKQDRHSAPARRPFGKNHWAEEAQTPNAVLSQSGRVTVGRDPTCRQGAAQGAGSSRGANPFSSSSRISDPSGRNAPQSWDAAQSLEIVTRLLRPTGVT